MTTEFKLFDDFITYCNEDNEKLAKDIQTWLSDYFDVNNRNIPLEQYEIDWIADNVSEENQMKIFGKVVSK